MGGDYAPRAIIEGVADASQTLGDDLHFYLVGDQDRVREELRRVGCGSDPRFEVVHAPEVIDMGDSPASAIRSKRRSSINLAVGLVKSGAAEVVFSAGNTGAAVASTVLKLRMLPGIERPGILTVFPSLTGHFVLIDAGSTVDCKPIHLSHYAIMGDVYQRHILGRPDPRVGLLNVGGEHSKGNDLSKEAFRRLRSLPDINFIGNVEGHDLFNGHVDVVVCDGFVGNVVLKSSESLAGAITEMLRRNLSQNWLRKLGYLLSRGAFRDLRRTCDPSEFGGAPLLGVNGICIIGHGASSPKAVRNAMQVAGEFVSHEVNAHIVERVQKVRRSPDPA